MGSSVVGVGIGDPLVWGLPCCLGRLPGASFVRLGSGYECAPGLRSTLGTHHARQALPRSGVIMVPHPLLCRLGGPQDLPNLKVIISPYISSNGCWILGMGFGIWALSLVSFSLLHIRFFFKIPISRLYPIPIKSESPWPGWRVEGV